MTLVWGFPHKAGREQLCAAPSRINSETRHDRVDLDLPQAEPAPHASPSRSAP
jgi:hypothetical protein